VRRVVASFLALVVLAACYLALDVADVVPGILTRDRPVTALPQPEPSATATATIPRPLASTAPLASESTAPVPTRVGLRNHLATALDDPALGSSLGVSIRDGRTGKALLERDADTPRVPASTVKLLTAAAVGATLDPAQKLVTSVVRGSTPEEVVLRAGGDTMLARGRGKPTAVEGRAGLADLAKTVAAALPAGTAKVTLRLDLSYAAGPRYAPGWAMADVAMGYTQGVSMVGLAGQRPRPFHPSPARPEREVAAAFRAALAKEGITVTLAPESTWDRPAPDGATVLGEVESASVADVLALAMHDSDNALTEGLARQAAVAAGGETSFEAVVAFVLATVEEQGIDVSGVTMRDTSGLSSGQAVPARVLADLLALGTTGKQEGMAHTLAGLPVAGLEGTLHDRFAAAGTRPAAGIARAKTGTLTGASALAGTLVDRDGRLLSYVVLADRVTPTQLGTVAARAALDRFVAALATCGCR
jgi:D-alanyl-D-alanine carboxypeptidase/D-alanyl-D-alanine-endopeptidase (penicillin-binding protein 4)